MIVAATLLFSAEVTSSAPAVNGRPLSAASSQTLATADGFAMIEDFPSGASKPAIVTTIKPSNEINVAASDSESSTEAKLALSADRKSLVRHSIEQHTPITSDDSSGTRVVCNEASLLGQLLPTIEATDTSAIGASILKKGNIKKCGAREPQLAELLSVVKSRQSKASGKYLNCVAQFSEFANVLELAESNSPPTGTFECDLKDIRGDGAIGPTILNETNSDKAVDQMFHLVLRTSSVEAASADQLMQCCGNDAKLSAKTCGFLRSAKRKGLSRKYGIRSLLLEGYKLGLSDAKLAEFSKSFDRFVELDRANSDREDGNRKFRQDTLLEMCRMKLAPVDCVRSYVPDIRSTGDFTAVAKNLQPKSSDMASTPAMMASQKEETSAPSIPAALAAAAGKTTTTTEGRTTTTVRTTKTEDGYQRITVRRDNSQAVNEDFSRYASIGPMTKQLAAFSKSAVRQVIPEASAASGQSYSFKPTAASLGTDVPVLEANVDGKVSFIKGSVPFDGTSVGRPVIATGSSIAAVNSAYGRALAASPNPNTKSRTPSARIANAANAANDSSPAGGGSLESSGGSVGGSTGSSFGGSSGSATSASAGAPGAAPTSNGARGAGTANLDPAARAKANVNNSPIIFPSVTDFHRALATAEKPSEFLTAQEISLRNWNLQVVYRGQLYPEKPDYLVKRRERYEEVKRMFTK